MLWWLGLDGSVIGLEDYIDKPLVTPSGGHGWSVFLTSLISQELPALVW